MVLLGKLALSTNAFLVDTDTMQLETEAITTATTIGQSMLEKITVRQYDNNCPPGIDTLHASSLVAPQFLGIDAGETSDEDTTFSDIDDFKGFVDSVATPRFGMYYLTCRVYYANESSPYDSVYTATMLKRIDVVVSNSFMTNPSDPLKIPGPVTVSRYFAYK